MTADTDERAATERDIRARVEAGDVDAAATLAIATYGPEIHGFLRAVARDDDLAAEAFATASEQLWRGLPAFRWEASIRTWAYQLARHALYQLRAAPSRRPERNLPLSIAPSIQQALRTATSPYQRTEVKAGLRALREALDPQDHELMILRLDRNMSWKDIARALAAEGETASVDQRAAALRKRFERAKVRLRELALEHGLIPDD